MDSKVTKQEDTEEEAPSTRLLSKGVTCNTALLKHACCTQDLSDISWTYTLLRISIVFLEEGLIPFVQQRSYQ